MRRARNWLTMIIAAAVAAFLALGVSPALAAPAAETERVIVQLAPGQRPEAAVGRLAARGGRPVKVLPGANAVVLEVTPSQRRALSDDPSVARVEADALYSVAVKPSTSRVRSTQVLPWGIDRIDADLAWPISRAAGVRVAIVDTGIDVTHPDLAGNIAGGYSAVDYTTSYRDDNGHGTHVAGTVGAIDNLTGVIGAAPRSSLLGVKVLDSAGSGWVSDIIEGIDWAVANGAQVINLSLSGSTYVSAFQAAIDRANAAGAVVVAAAGNTGGSVGFPAAYNGVIAVSATDSWNRIASFSSRGPEVDLAAPGVTIRSTYWSATRGSTYADLSGTSMAAPHVAGAAALVLTTPVGAWDADADGLWDPVEVEAKLEATALDLGDPGTDSLYGAGLVSAYRATMP